MTLNHASDAEMRGPPSTCWLINNKIEKSIFNSVFILFRLQSSVWKTQSLFYSFYIIFLPSFTLLIFFSYSVAFF